MEREKFLNRIQYGSEIDWLLKLQRDYEAGIVTEDVMTQEEIMKLEQLYLNQIERLKIQYENYKEKACSIMKKINSKKY